MAYLDDHPPVRSQFRDPRRETPSGVIVVHTAENVMDQLGPDTGAEGVAHFITIRDTPGSYHELVDSDSYVNLVRWTCEAFHDATGSNPHSWGLSFALRAEDWPTMADAKRAAFLERGAQRAAAYARWMRTTYGVIVPATRITRDESERRVPGFIAHAQRDPARRTDPGGGFPWATFLARFKALTDGTPTPTPPRKDDAMFFYDRPGNVLIHVTGGKQYQVAGAKLASRCRAHPDYLGEAPEDMVERWDRGMGPPIKTG